MKSLKLLWILLWVPLCVFGQDVYEIKFMEDNTQYRAALVMFEEDSARIRVKFFNDGTKVVEQSVEIENTQSGVQLRGYDPVYPGTTVEFPSYDANIFHLTKNQDSTYSIKNLDNDSTSKKPTIRKIEGEVEVEYFLFYFNWKLE